MIGKTDPLIQTQQLTEGKSDRLTQPSQNQNHQKTDDSNSYPSRPSHNATA
jgi:hypothetical protein